MHLIRVAMHLVRVSRTLTPYPYLNHPTQQPPILRPVAKRTYMLTFGWTLFPCLLVHLEIQYSQTQA